MDFGRILTAMVTPFDTDNQIDFDKATALIEYLLNNGSEGLVIGGTTGESPTLSADEKVALFKHTVEVVNHRVPVIAGTGSNDTHASVTLTKSAEEVGVDGVMLVAPYYNKPNQEGLFQHFSAIAQETSLPVILYNVPGRTAVNMTADTITRLSTIANITAVKDASGNLDQVSAVIDQTPDEFSVYSGEDSMTLPMLSVGADGVISVVSHIAGNDLQQMVYAHKAGNVREASRIHRQLLPVMKGLFAQPSPVPVKTALTMKGVETGGVRLPLIPLTDTERTHLKTLIES
ncbi:4-hydroxy-tetrahydrodipicolinate synthase [Barrientosiimonas marina]